MADPDERMEEEEAEVSRVYVYVHAPCVSRSTPRSSSADASCASCASCAICLTCASIPSLILSPTTTTRPRLCPHPHPRALSGWMTSSGT